MLLYSALLATVLLLRTLWHWKGTAKNMPATELKARLGKVPAELADSVAERTVWLHAVSVGEVLAASRLVRELEAALGPGWRVVVSTTTRTGQQLAREHFGANRVFYVPIDLASSMRAYLDSLRPAAVVLMESEIWPRMLHETKKRGIPVIVANARVSDRSFRRSRYVRWIWKYVLRRVTLWLAQTEEDARRLLAMGALPGSVRVGGNLKFDVRSTAPRPMTEALRRYAAGRPVLVAGSTVVEDRAHEEESLFAAVSDLWKTHPDLLVIVAPRHPERFQTAENLARARGATVRASSILSGADVDRDARIVLLDTIGDLAFVYSIATVAFVGGSMLWAGGHNPLEPAQFGVPIVMGSSFENFREIVRSMQAAHAILIAGNSRELHEAFARLLDHPEEAQEMGAHAREVFEAQAGATQRTVDAVLEQVQR